MKIPLGKSRRSAMTRAEFLIVVGVVLIGISLFVRYERTGEVFQISWRKRATQTNSQSGIIGSLETAPVNTDDAPETVSKTTAVNGNPISTNFLKRPATENSSPKSLLMRLNDAKKQTTRVPTNAVWFPSQRKRPGVRIAFP
jgi:hypothetical protein